MLTNNVDSATLPLQLPQMPANQGKCWQRS